MKYVCRPFRKLIVGVALGLAIFPSGAPAQVKQWTDEKGVTHFEAHDTGKTPSPRAGNADSKGTLGVAKVRIERSHKSITLGDNDSSYRNSSRWRFMGSDKFGAQGFISADVPDATKTMVLFFDQRLWSLSITYPENILGSWDKVVITTSEKYGPPKTNGYSEATWMDAQTVLNIKKDYRGGIEIMIVDIELRDRYNSRSGQAAPKF